MNINSIISTANHPKYIWTNLKYSEGLPFNEVLPAELIAEQIKNIDYRDRYYSPDITLWAFYHRF